MSLCKLTRTWEDNPPVYVNPLQVISVDSDGTNTWITATGSAGDKPNQIYVVEPLDVVVRRLDEHTPRFG